MRPAPATGSLPTSSLRRRLIIQLLAVAALLSALLYVSVRAVADKTAEATQDNILGASATSIAEQLGSGDEGIVVDIPYSAFSMLGAVSEEQVFYRISAGGLAVTGYDDLPLPEQRPEVARPVYYTVPFRGTIVRIAALMRVIPVENKPVEVLVLVAQTRLGQDAIAARVANAAAGLGIGFFIVAGLLSWFAAESALRPLRRVVEAVSRRGPKDLRPMRYPTPRELSPLVGALNGFMARLQAALTRTETFIAEAAHHVRTPLATVRAQAEIALRQAETDESRRTLRAVIRAVEESSRSAGQLLDHAMVSYRSDQAASDILSLADLTEAVVNALMPTADMKDLTIDLTIQPVDTRLSGDRVLIESALRNLVDNAIKYSPAEHRIAISVGAGDGKVSVIVMDEGRGLGGVAQSTLTQRFSRGSNVDDIVGSGLGLTIVEEVARAHGGVFELTPRKGGGTCASLSLPQR